MRLLAMLAFAAVRVSHAVLWMPSHFGNGMVLQTWANYHMAARLYGTAVPGEGINATTDDPAWPWLATVADDAGAWAITFNLPPGSGTKGFALTITGTSSPQPLIFSDVKWGDVFVCAGDSSLLLPTTLALNGSEWLASSPVTKWLSNGDVRLFAAAAFSATVPQSDFVGSGTCGWPGHGDSTALPCNTWTTATAASAAVFSAACLQFAAQLALSAGAPGNAAVGLVQLAANATPIEGWLPAAADASRCSALPPRPGPAVLPAGFYNGMLAPLGLQTVRAALLSFGGSDLPLLAGGAVTPGAYACHLAAAINGIRVVPGVGDYPVLLPLMQATADGAAAEAGDALFTLRAEQLQVLPRAGGSVDAVATAYAPDAGVSSLVPPGGGATVFPAAATNTLPMATRLAGALAYAGFWRFGDAAWGPKAAAAAAGAGATVTVSFAFAPDGVVGLPNLIGLPAPGCSACCAGTSAAAQLATGPDGPWVNTSVIVSANNATAVLTPAAAGPYAFVRYGAAPATAPECLLSDTTTGLPATPFLLPIVAAAAAAWSESVTLPHRNEAASESSSRGSRFAAAAAAQSARASGEDGGNLLSSSAHLIRPDGSFDRQQYLLHGRARAVAAAAAAATAAAGTVGVGSRIAAPTPPMGFNSWQAFRCNVDEALMARVGDAFVASGLRDAGYRWVNFDDCVMRSRLSNGSLAEDEVRFPSRLFALQGALAAQGLGLGIYTSATASTCVGRPGSYQHEDVDTARWCEWGVGYVKVDNCGGKKYPAINTSWIAIRAGLSTHCVGRPPVVLSVETCGDPKPSGCGGWIRDSGATLWRTTGDLQLYWQSVMENFDGNERMAPLAGPGHWNDPDMLIVGHPGLSPDESRSHFGAWAISAAPLMLSFDPTSPARLSPAVVALVANPEVLAVDQDAAGVQGVRVTDPAPDGAECWARPLAAANGTATAVLLLNRGATPADVTCDWTAVAPGVLSPSTPAAARDLWAHTQLGVFTGSYTAHALPPHASALITLVPA